MTEASGQVVQTAITLPKRTSDRCEGTTGGSGLTDKFLVVRATGWGPYRGDTDEQYV